MFCPSGTCLGCNWRYLLCEIICVGLLLVCSMIVVQQTAVLCKNAFHILPLAFFLVLVYEYIYILIGEQVRNDQICILK